MSKAFDELVQLMAKLRAPDGCAWDRKQTHVSLKPYLVEEAYEVLEAIDHTDTTRLREELGDVLLQVIFHAQIGAEEKAFSVEDIIHSLSQKLVRRHPHVFGTADQKQEHLNADDVKVRWEQIKRNERAEKGQDSSALEGVPKTLPALLRAFQVQARAARVGFDWPDLAPVLGKLDEELQEFREAMAANTAATPATAKESKEHLEAELGDVFFTMVNIARFLKINPEEALRTTINRFIDRFQYIESQAIATERSIQDMTLEEMDALWEHAKHRTPVPIDSKEH
ncbi:MAG TPA: nucleoside triphosphate pyrophosphohydrolase [Nitrospiraceae bacterium]|nr:nucleoside triphosphate pyrophosphohydrolase [Nitrospiraceae bacterium]